MAGSIVTGINGGRKKLGQQYSENVGISINGIGDQKKRNEFDFYPTPTICTFSIMKFLIDHKIITPGGIVYECCCGDGAMSKVIEQHGFEVIGTDLRDAGIYGYDRIDFLKQDPYKFDAVITNPPFNIAIDIIEHALKFAPVVVMLLKSNYWHVKERYNFFMKHTPAYVLPLSFRPNFYTNGGTGTMDFQFTVWVEGDHITKYIPLKKIKTNLTLF